MGMVRPERALSDFQALLMEDLRLIITAALMKQIGKIVHRRKGVDVLVPKDALPLGKAFAKEFFSCRILPLILKQKRLFLQLLGAHWRERRRRLFGPLVRSNSDDHNAKNDSNTQKPKKSQAPSQSTGLKRVAGSLSGGIDGRKLIGDVADQRERTSGGYKVNPKGDFASGLHPAEMEDNFFAKRRQFFALATGDNYGKRLSDLHDLAPNSAL